LPAVIRTKGINGGSVTISTKASSQFASALEMIKRFGNFDVTRQGIGFSYDYVGMTVEMIKRFSNDYFIEPDLTSASYFRAAGFVTGGNVEIDSDLKLNESLQFHEKEFPLFLTLLNPLEQDSVPLNVSRTTGLGDSIMTLAVCALFSKRPLIVKEASRMRVQECDRIEKMVLELKKVGAHAEEDKDGFTVWPLEATQVENLRTTKKNIVIETYNDHRIAMCFSVLGLKVPGIRIKNPACVSKTFPNFYDKLKQLGAELIDVKTGTAL